MKAYFKVAGVTLSVLMSVGTWQAMAADDIVKIGILGDRSSAYSAIGGEGSVVAAQMAAEDAGEVLGASVEIISADHQNKPDIGAAIARQWYDEEGVDMIADLAGSSVALAVINLAAEKHKIAITSAGSSDITGKFCTPYSAQWTYDTYGLGKALAGSVVRDGGKSWYFITVDYSFGHALERDATRFIEAAGGTVVGGVRAPFNTFDFSSYLLQAQSSGAKVVGLANTGQDTVRAIKQGIEFGIPEGGQTFVGLNVFLTDVHSLGIDDAQGLKLVAPFYWGQDDEARQWSMKFEKRFGSPPTYIQAGVYSAVKHYLDAVKAVGSTNADDVMRQMRETPINDFMTKNGKLRKDGHVVRDMYVFEVKKPSESQGEWDLYKRVSRLSGEEASRPLDEGGCPLVSGAASTAD